MHPQQSPFGAPLEGAHCARHPERQARAICSRCGSYACGECQQFGADGRDLCLYCHSRAPVLASRGARFVANLVDQFAVVFPWILGAVIQGVINASNGGDGDMVLMGLGGLVSLGMGIFQLVLVSQNGQSLGKRMMKIRLLRTDGSPVSLGRVVFVRNLVPAFINSFCGLFSLVDALFIFNDDRRCLHDAISDTKVVEAPPEG